MSSKPEDFEVAFTIVKCGDKFIFQHRDNNPDIASPGLFAAFGGAVEPEESLIDAAVRELREETSLEIDKNNLTYLGSINVPVKRGGTRHAFIAEVQNDSFDVYEGQDKVSFTWADLIKMELDKFTPSTKEAIKRYIIS